MAETVVFIPRLGTIEDVFRYLEFHESAIPNEVIENIIERFFPANRFWARWLNEGDDFPKLHESLVKSAENLSFNLVTRIPLDNLSLDTIRKEALQISVIRKISQIVHRKSKT